MHKRVRVIYKFTSSLPKRYLPRFSATARNLKNNPAITSFGKFITLVLVIIIISISITNYELTLQTISNAKPFWLLAAIVLNLICYAIFALGWHLLIQYQGHSLSLQKTYYIFFLTNITRYLPGGIWHFGGRLFWLRNLSVSISASAKIVFLEQFMPLLIGFAIGILAFLELFSNSYQKIILFISCLSLLYIATIMISRLPQANFSKALQLTILYVLFWLCYGASIYALIISFVPSGIPIVKFFPVVGISSISWTLGYIIFFIPGGLGVRESVFAVLLSSTVTLPIASTIAIATRLLSLLSETTWAMSLIGLEKLREVTRNGDT